MPSTVPLTGLLFSTYRFPQILELSGIGKKSVLDKIGIPQKLDLPGVGENLQEHVVLCISWGETSLTPHDIESSLNLGIELKDSVKYDARLAPMRGPC